MPADGRERAGSLDVQLGRVGRPGWVELRAAGLRPGANPVELMLQRAGGSGRVAYALTPSSVGSIRQILHLEDPVAAASLRLAAPETAGATARLRPLSWRRLLSRALRIDRREALLAVRWRLVGKRVRARNILLRLVGQPQRMDVEGWLGANAPRWADETPALMAQRAALAEVRCAVLVAGTSETGIAPVTRASVARQLLGADASVHALGSIVPETADWLLVLPDGHVLADDAWLRIAAAIHSDTPPAAVTWDSDAIDADGARHAVELKPQWNAAFYLARDYIGAFAVSRRAVEYGLAVEPSLPRELPDALLLAAARSSMGPFLHVPRILSHRMAEAARPDEESRMAARRALVQAFVRGESPEATATLAGHGALRVTYPLPEPPPLVSLIVPTRDRLDLLAPCLEGLLARTAYAPFEILVADNGSRQAATHRFLAQMARDPRIRIIDCAGPFNFAAINNRAAAEARGRVLGFVNNDIEPLASDWLDIMVRHALRPRIGAVGAKLLYPSGLVQHAGVVLGVGGHAGHAHRFMRPGDLGYLGRLQCEQHYAAVTAACLVVERAKFEAVGGFDAVAFPVAYNDVDMCLRLNAAGFATLWTPYAELLHKESASRARDTSPARRAAYEAECRRLIDRWGPLVADDPHYHPALSRRLENFSLEAPGGRR
jgi:GT2 family glycosyltransferase